METNRGKKGKKAIWHLTLGLKDTIFAGIGIVGLMMMSFALGALAGRGDIYRVAYSWGLLAPDGTKVAQWAPPGVAPVVVPQGPPTAAGTAPVASASPTPAGAPAPVAVAAKQPGAAPVTGSLAATPASAPSVSEAKKKAKSGSTARERKAREEEMHRLRQEVAQKLKFQNSFDSGPKPAKSSAKQKSKEKETKSTQVRVGLFRDAKSARAKVAELQKKGIKASLKPGKDQKGAYYVVYRQAAPTSPGSEKLAQKPDKSESPKKPDSR